MRKIKFRHPILQNGKFIEWHYWGFIDGGFETPAIPMSYKNDGRLQSFQFTNLHDKCGNEFYEGDIGKYLDTYFEVVWRDGCFKVNFTNGAVGLLSDFTKDSEVVGNIVENPDLLVT